MASSSENISMAVFCDFENVALGVRDANYDKFDIKPVLERLLLKGSIVVKKSYCDWDRYKGFKATMHEANFELIEIPHVRQSGKNSADIRMVVDALDLCYTKAHVDTFVIISGDSDFSPLVSKLRENAKRVIGVGVKNSTSDLLVANCDEFIFYDDLVREVRRAAAKRDERKAQPQAPAQQGRRPSAESDRKREEMEARKLQALEMVVETFDALVSERGDTGKIWASLLKDTLKRRRPDFSESYYGFRTFGNLLEDAQTRGLFEFGRDEKSGTYVFRNPNVQPELHAAEPLGATSESEQMQGADEPGTLEGADQGSADGSAQAGGEPSPARESRRGRGGRGRKSREQGGVNEAANPRAEANEAGAGMSGELGSDVGGDIGGDVGSNIGSNFGSERGDKIGGEPGADMRAASGRASGRRPARDKGLAAWPAPTPDLAEVAQAAAASEEGDDTAGATGTEPGADAANERRRSPRTPRAPRKPAARKGAAAAAPDEAGANPSASAGMAEPMPATVPAPASAAAVAPAPAPDAQAARPARPGRRGNTARAAAGAVAETPRAADQGGADSAANAATDSAAGDANADTGAHKQSARPSGKSPSRKPAARPRRPAKPKAPPENA